MYEKLIKKKTLESAKNKETQGNQNLYPKYRKTKVVSLTLFQYKRIKNKNFIFSLSFLYHLFKIIFK
jgi:hypothetical protein